MEPEGIKFEKAGYLSFFIHSFTEYLLSNHYVPGSNIAVTMKDITLSHHGAYNLVIHRPP